MQKSRRQGRQRCQRNIEASSPENPVRAFNVSSSLCWPLKECLHSRLLMGLCWFHVFFSTLDDFGFGSLLLKPSPFVNALCDFVFVVDFHCCFNGFFNGCPCEMGLIYMDIWRQEITHDPSRRETNDPNSRTRACCLSMAGSPILRLPLGDRSNRGNGAEPNGLFTLGSAPVTSPID